MGGTLSAAIAHLWGQHGAHRKGSRLYVTNAEGHLVKARSVAGKLRGWIMPPLRDDDY
jgi:hypothetical protein